MAHLSQRLSAVLTEILPVTEEEDGALTVQHGQTFASLRVVPIAPDLDLVSLTQVLVWELPLNDTTRAEVGAFTHETLLGTVSLVEKVDPPEDGAAIGDVLLRYNFPAAGLTDDALRTLLLMVLATGSDVRRALTG